ncbi:hypothetical protein LSTR_LSTR007921 [Laodelphax striatellus]|uniref:Uncharacterized protein n=1 Tax=Laodelphax striatellus TaxID=195883 RepID=A0A482XM48_LAOST|nr:hypothetical protein LSTR_LSTR007921 [Laodelphax striatellus]
MKLKLFKTVPTDAETALADAIAVSTGLSVIRTAIIVINFVVELSNFYHAVL